MSATRTFLDIRNTLANEKNAETSRQNSNIALGQLAIQKQNQTRLSDLTKRELEKEEQLLTDKKEIADLSSQIRLTEQIGDHLSRFASVYNGQEPPSPEFVNSQADLSMMAREFGLGTRIDPKGRFLFTVEGENEKGEMSTQDVPYSVFKMKAEEARRALIVKNVDMGNVASLLEKSDPIIKKLEDEDGNQRLVYITRDEDGNLIQRDLDETSQQITEALTEVVAKPGKLKRAATFVKDGVEAVIQKAVDAPEDYPEIFEMLDSGLGVLKEKSASILNQFLKDIDFKNIIDSNKEVLREVGSDVSEAVVSDIKKTKEDIDFSSSRIKSKFDKTTDKIGDKTLDFIDSLIFK